jgi:hypothetical protein
VKKNTSRADSGFAYSRKFFEQLVDSALSHARKLGASDAAAEASEGCGLSVSVRKGELENVERNRDKSLGITVYLGQKRGNASTSDFSAAAIEATVQAAYDIARFTASDPAAGLPDQDDIAKNPPELDLCHPWAITAEQAAELALGLGVQRYDWVVVLDPVAAEAPQCWQGNARQASRRFLSRRYLVFGNIMPKISRLFLPRMLRLRSANRTFQPWSSCWLTALARQIHRLSLALRPAF